MAKKKAFDWKKVLSGFKRPLIAGLAALAAYYLGVDEVMASSVAGVLVERVISTVEYFMKK